MVELAMLTLLDWMSTRLECVKVQLLILELLNSTLSRLQSTNVRFIISKSFQTLSENLHPSNLVSLNLLLSNWTALKVQFLKTTSVKWLSLTKEPEKMELMKAT